MIAGDVGVIVIIGTGVGGVGVVGDNETVIVGGAGVVGGSICLIPTAPIEVRAEVIAGLELVSGDGEIRDTASGAGLEDASGTESIIVAADFGCVGGPGTVS